MSLGGGEHHPVAGAYDAAVTGIGGGLRVLRRDGSNLVSRTPPTSCDRACPGHSWHPGRTGWRTGPTPSVRTRPTGGVECEWDPAVLPWVQGEGLVLLFPGGDHTAAWTVRAL